MSTQNAREAFHLLCHQCGSPDLSLAPWASAYKRVTSDCKPWRAGGTLAVCKRCGLAQSPATPQWKNEVRRIYRKYTLYRQSGGVEQAVYPSSKALLRSDRILAKFKQCVSLPARGRLLDVGCGRGTFLRTFGRHWPQWELHGMEKNAKNKTDLESLPGVRRLHTRDLSGVPGNFEVVSLIHVLEHIPDPGAALIALKKKISRGGALLIQVPDCAANPFMLFVADHCSHFTIESLSAIVGGAGFDILQATNQWVPREITLVARPTSEFPVPRSISAPSRSLSMERTGHWISGVVKQTVSLAYSGRPFGIFGTSIAATWLHAQVGGREKFFTDEDESRVGRRFFGKPVLPPTDIPLGSTVFVGLPPAAARRVADRIRRRGLRVEIPPPLVR